MRYSITGATIQQVQAVGGVSIKGMHSAKITFATLTEAQASDLRKQGFTVSKVENIKTSTISPVPVSAEPIYTPEQYLEASGLDVVREMMSPPLYGSGFTIAIIDTGIRETHEKINGRVVYSKNFTEAPMRDGFDHGSAIAAIVVSVAPQCNILNLKCMDDEGAGTEEEVALAIDECISLLDEKSDIAPHVINLSLGGEDTGNPNTPLRTICRAAIEKGIWIFAAAGNSGPSPGTIMSPACERYVGCVGSVKFEPFTISEFSSRGPTLEGLTKPDAVIFGEDMIVASSESDTATVAKSGTSFSTPFGSAMGVLTKEGMLRQATLTSPIAGVTYEEAWAMSSQDLLDKYLPLIAIKPAGAPAGRDNEYGYGLPFGPALRQLLQPVGISISSVIPLIMMVGMLGIMVKVMK